MHSMRSSFCLCTKDCVFLYLENKVVVWVLPIALILQEWSLKRVLTEISHTM